MVSSVAFVRSGMKSAENGHHRGVVGRDRGGEQISMTELRRSDAVAPSDY